MMRTDMVRSLSSCFLLPAGGPERSGCPQVTEAAREEERRQILFLSEVAPAM